MLNSIEFFMLVEEGINLAQILRNNNNSRKETKDTDDGLQLTSNFKLVPKKSQTDSAHPNISSLSKS
jgi:hypothetical protein